MITTAQARATAAKRLAAKSAAWAVGDWVEPVVTIALKPPSEREMLADQKAAEAWARQWRALDLGAGPGLESGAGPGLGPGARPSGGPDGGTGVGLGDHSGSGPAGTGLDWEARNWRSIGRQEVPVRLVLATPDDVADFVGGVPRRDWRRLAARTQTLIREFADADRDTEVCTVARRNAKQLTAFPDDTFTMIVAVTRWLLENPMTGMRPRELPIRGVDSKWFGTHRTLLTALVRAAGGDIGIVDADPLLRVRVLDSDLAGGGPHDFAAPVAELNRMAYSPSTVFVFENKESVLAMPPVPGALVIHGSGYAVDMLGQVDWLRDVPIVYWDDLDSHGFAILDQLRAVHPGVTSVLMDEATLSAHRDLWVAEPIPHRGTFTRLTEAERATLDRLRCEGDVRLEQERIPWDTAIAALLHMA